MKVQTRMGRGRRIWVCPVCSWRATISTRKHFQTGQPLTFQQQVASLAVDAERHFRDQHRDAFSRASGAVSDEVFAVVPVGETGTEGATRAKGSW